MKRIIVIGAGGHAKVVIDIMLQRKKAFNDNLIIEGILDDSFIENEKKELFGIPIIGKINKILELSSDIYYVIAIGNNSIRRKISKDYKNLKYITLIHPKAIIAENVIIYEGTVVMAGVIINSYTKIGKHCIVNTGSIIEHDNIIGDCVHVSPNATLCGGISVEDISWIGAGATIMQNVKIGTDSIIGAGAIVVKNIPSNCTAVGNPAKPIKFKESR